MKETIYKENIKRKQNTKYFEWRKIYKDQEYSVDEKQSGS